MKYIIKNCPFNKTTAHFCLGGKDIEYCKNVANCLLKQMRKNATVMQVKFYMKAKQTNSNLLREIR